MSLLWSALLAGSAVGCLLALPSAAGLRLEQLQPPAGRPAAPPRPGPEGLSLAVGRRMLLVAVLGLVALAAVAPGLVVPALLAVGAVVAGARVRRDRVRAAARRREHERAVEACGALAAELRAGRAPADALLTAAGLAAGPSRTALLAAAGAARLGGDAAAALGSPGDTAVPEVLRALAACWTVCSGSGSGLASAVERLEEGLRADAAQRRAVDAELAGPRATAGLLAVLPVLGLLLAAGLGADPLHVLLTTPVGLVCLAGGLLLDATGLWWTGRLVARAGGTA